MSEKRVRFYMYWNYRVVKKTLASGEVLHEIHEAYYKEDGSVEFLTKGAISPFGESRGDLKADLLKMLEACEKDPLSDSLLR